MKFAPKAVRAEICKLSLFITESEGLDGFAREKRGLPLPAERLATTINSISVGESVSLAEFAEDGVMVIPLRMASCTGRLSLDR
jgi:hypothetical protein